MNQQSSNQRNQQHENKHKHKQQDQAQRQQTHPPAATIPTQSQIYDNLRRIGELEDKKLSIQNEIESRTVKLRGALPHVAPDSLLYKMLSSVLGKADASPAAATKSTTGKKAAKKKSTKRAAKKSTKSKKKTKKRSSKKRR